MSKEKGLLINFNENINGKDTNVTINTVYSKDTKISFISEDDIGKTSKQLGLNKIFSKKIFTPDISFFKIFSDYFDKIEIYKSYTPVDHISIYVYSSSPNYPEIDDSFIESDSSKLVINTRKFERSNPNKEYLRLLIYLPHTLDNFYCKTSTSNIHLDNSINITNIRIISISNNISVYSLFENISIKTGLSYIKFNPNTNKNCTIFPLSIDLRDGIQLNKNLIFN